MAFLALNELFRNGGDLKMTNNKRTSVAQWFPIRHPTSVSDLDYSAAFCSAIAYSQMYLELKWKKEKIKYVNISLSLVRSLEMRN